MKLIFSTIPRTGTFIIEAMLRALLTIMDTRSWLVATSQDLVSMIVNKARNMASMMKVPVLGMVENMSFIKCPHCGDEIRLYGDGSSIEKSAAEIGSKVTDKLPLDPEVTKLVDSGNAEKVSEDILTGTTEMAAGLINK